MEDSLTNFIRQGDKIDIHGKEEEECDAKEEEEGAMTTISCVR